MTSREDGSSLPPFHSAHELKRETAHGGNGKEGARKGDDTKGKGEEIYWYYMGYISLTFGSHS